MGIIEVLPWVLSVHSCVLLWLMGDYNRWGPPIGLFGQIFWVWYVVATEQWGLLPGVLVYAGVNARNWYKMYCRRKVIEAAVAYTRNQLRHDSFAAKILPPVKMGCE